MTPIFFLLLWKSDTNTNIGRILSSGNKFPLIPVMISVWKLKYIMQTCQIDALNEGQYTGSN